MFIKMLKKDLQRKKGLNIILFIFMMVASTLVVVSAIQVFAHLEGRERSFNLCNSSGLIVVNESKLSERESNVGWQMEWFCSRPDVKNCVHSERILIDSACIDFEDFDEDTTAPFFEKDYFFDTLPQNQNLVYDLQDQPFYVQNGEIALPQNTMDLIGLSIGDKVQITTPMGYTYEFTIGHFFKDTINQGERFLLSDADYQLIASQYPIKLDAYELQLTENSDVTALKNAYLAELKGENVCIGETEDPYDYTYIYLYIVSAFMVILSVFMILIILMTIRFTLIASIDEEEKEIGMMKAIGVDSFGFRWAFAAKYISFALVSGVVGILAGIPLAKILLNMFMKNRIQPPIPLLVLIGIASTIMIVALIIFFTIMVMRRINRISVMDAIHGKDQSENFSKLSGLRLYMRKHMKVRTYLAISDILNGMRKYMFLLISYMLGIVIILCTVHLRNSVMSVEFERYFLTMRLDFYMDFSDELTEEYEKRTGGAVTIYDLINDELKEAGIPASIDSDNYTLGTLNLPCGGEKDIRMLYGDYKTTDFVYREGGTAPQLDNEIALSYFTASQYGLQVGDRIKLKYREYTEDGTSSQEVTKEFVITAFFDFMEGFFAGEPAMGIMGQDFHSGVLDGRFFLQEMIHAPKEEFPEVIAQMRAMYGEGSVKTTEEAMDYYMAGFNQILALMEYLLSGVVILVLILITSLNSTVLLTQEIPKIAMLKSLGIYNHDIKVWQMLRMGILVAISLVLGNVILDTLGQAFISFLFGFLGMTGFKFLIEPVATYFVVPIMVGTVILITQYIRLRSVKNIEIWKIRTE